jgi:hypothetical protein
MTIPRIIIYISIVLWTFPLYKQYKTRYFVYFLILSLADPVKLSLFFLFHLGFQKLSWVIILLMLISLIQSRKIKLVLIGISIIGIVLSLSFNFDKNTILYLTFAIHIIIWGNMILLLLKRMVEFQSLNLFLSFLVLYQLITIFRYLAIILNNNSGGLSNFIGGICQFLFAILFAFININTKDFAFIPKGKFEIS